MLMPEAAINEYRGLCSDECNIGSPWKIFSMEPVAEPGRVRLSGGAASLALCLCA